VLEHQLGMIAFTLLPFAVVGVYLSQAEEIGAAGLIAFAVALAGATLYMGGIFADTFLFPAIAATSPEVVEGVLTARLDGAMLWGFGGMAVLFTGGLALLGALTWRAGILPRTAGLLLAVGAIGFGPGSALPKLLQTGGAVILGAGLIWLGAALWQRFGAQAYQPDTV
jgi:hypothetical protein